MIIGYIDKNYKNIKSELQKELIENYAHEHNLTIDVYFAHESIHDLSKSLQTNGHTLIVANVVSLGDSLKAITQSIKDLLEKGNTIHCTIEDFTLEPNQSFQELLKGLEMAADIRSSMNSIITRNVLHEKRANGQKLGRAFGIKNKKSILNQSGEFIMQALAQGRTKADIARELNVSWRAVYEVQKQYEVRHA